MNKVLLSSIILIIVLSIGWFFFFQDQKLSFLSNSSKHQQSSSSTLGIKAQALDSDLSTTNFLQNLPISAESGVYSFNISYTNSNTGEVKQRLCCVTVPDGFTQKSTGSYPVYFFFHGTSQQTASPANNSCKQLVGSGCVSIVLLGSNLVSTTGTTTTTVYSWDVKDSTGTYTTGADDLSLVNAVWDAIKKDPRLDLTKVYACGHSVGSLFISNELAPKTSIFTGHLCLSSQLLTTTGISAAQKPINIVTIHGEADPLIPVGGGPASFNADINFLSEEETINAWSQHNGCSGGTDYSSDSFNYTFTSQGSNTQQTISVSYTKYASLCSNGLVCGYRLKNIQHNTIDPAMQLFGVTNTAALTLAVFGGSLV